MSNQSYSKEFKYEVLLAYENRDYTIRELCSKFQISKSSLKRWIEQFEKYGMEGLKQSKSWNPYSKELKEAAVRDYLSGNFSQPEIVRKYEISTTSLLRKWINKYNSHRALKDTSKGRTSSMTKGRKTTWDERKQVVFDCLENGKDYHKTADIYEVSYQQVYQWVKKYLEGEKKHLRTNGVGIR